MENRLTELSYEDWLEHVFSHEIRKYQAAWHFDLDAPPRGDDRRPVARA